MRDKMQRTKRKKSLVGYTDNNAPLALLDWYFIGQGDIKRASHEFILKKRQKGHYKKVRITIQELK